MSTRCQYFYTLGEEVYFTRNWGFYSEGVLLWRIGVGYSQHVKWFLKTYKFWLLKSYFCILMERKLLRLGPPYPRSCMDKLIRMHTKMHTNGEPCSPSLAIAGFVKEWFRVWVPLLAPNISDLAPKTVRTNADKWLICVQSAYKIRRKLRILFVGCLTVKN